MGKRSNYELLGKLQRLDKLPSNEVKQGLDGLRMTFSEWQSFTNEDLGYFMYGQIKGYKQKFEDKVDISYEEYLEMQHLPITRELPRESNIARRERQRGVMSEDEVSTLEEIEALWENVRAKYDPVQEVIRSAKEASDMFMYYTSSDRLPVGIEEVKRSISQLKKSTRYIDASKELDEECLAFEDELVKAMEEGLSVLEKLQNSTDLSVEEFMMKFGLDKEEVDAYFKNRMEMAAEGKDNAPFIKAEEGRGFRLNEEGKLEIVDESKAKDLIADVFVTGKVLDGAIDVLGSAKKYERLTQYLPERPKYSVGIKEVEALIKEIDDLGDVAVADWMIENPKRINAMQMALQENGIGIDYESMVANLSIELENYYNDDSEQVYNKDRMKKISEFIYRMNYVPEEEYVEEYGEDSEESISELMKQVVENDKRIADNDEKIRQALKDKILKQQQQIEAQEAEITQLRGEKSNEK